MNISNRLKDLFNESLLRECAEKKSRFHCYHGSSSFNAQSDDIKGALYFYEWSDINRSPRTFYFMSIFEKFLIDSGITLQGYEKEIIKNITNPYVSCKKGSKELIIKSSFDVLKKALENDSSFKSGNSVPYNVQCTHPPIHRPMIYQETKNTMQEQVDLNGFQY